MRLPLALGLVLFQFLLRTLTRGCVLALPTFSNTFSQNCSLRCALVTPIDVDFEVGGRRLSKGRFPQQLNTALAHRTFLALEIRSFSEP